MLKRCIEGEGVSVCVCVFVQYVCTHALSGKVRESKEIGELYSELIMCQHCSVWEVAPGECCPTHEGEIQQLFQRKS